MNECQTNNGGCNQTCTNSYGSFKCFCDVGYSLAIDGLDCDGKKNVFVIKPILIIFNQMWMNVLPIMEDVTRHASTLKAPMNVTVT